MCCAAASAEAQSVTLPHQPDASPPPRQSSSIGFAPAPPAPLPQLADGVVYTVSPSDADPQLKRFTTANIVMFKRGVAPNANLLVYFPGTGGTPASGALFLEAAANAGYRVISLQYDNANAVPTICGPNPDPACSDRFRQKRVFGDDTTKDIDDSPSESIVSRLTKLLQYLDAHHHDEGWGRYLRGAEPNWSRIAFAGHSQGGGHAAYIAKKEKVARVIVLSGAGDWVNATKVFAPWVASPSKTPPDRWYAAYHQKESRAEALAKACELLKIPPGHVRVMKLEPNGPPNTNPAIDAYHGSMISERTTPRDTQGNPAYAPDWAFFLGKPN